MKNCSCRDVQSLKSSQRFKRRLCWVARSTMRKKTPSANFVVTCVLQHRSRLVSPFLNWNHLLVAMCTCAFSENTKKDGGYALLREKCSSWFIRVSERLCRVFCRKHKCATGEWSQELLYGADKWELAAKVRVSTHEAEVLCWYSRIEHNNGCVAWICTGFGRTEWRQSKYGYSLQRSWVLRWAKWCCWHFRWWHRRSYNVMYAPWARGAALLGATLCGRFESFVVRIAKSKRSLTVVCRRKMRAWQRP